MSDADVAVVGAGPVGMTAAALLAARGLRVAVFERNAGVTDAPKAISIDDEALRIYQAAGLAERLLRIIVPGTGTRYYDANGQPVFQARSQRPYRHGYPFKNPFAQPDLEREILEHLRQLPSVDVRLRTEVTDLEQDAGDVYVHCLGEEGSSVVRARYLLGCDGARSTVRERLRVGMTGRGYDDVWLVADVVGDHHEERYGMHHADPARPHVIIPGQDGRCRYEFRLRPGEGEPGIAPAFALVRSLLSPFRSITPDEVVRAVTYRFNALVAEHLRIGRVFLLGDAAHMMPPFAGQGLNSGIRDAANLCWKVVDVLAGRLDESALATYEQERRPHIEATVRLSTRLGRVVMTTSPRLAHARDRLIRSALRSPESRAFFEEMRYRPAQEYATGLVVGDETLLAGRQIGQPRAFDMTERRVRMLDDVLGYGWALLGVGVAPQAFPAAAHITAPIEPTAVLVTVDQRLPVHHRSLRMLVDVDGGLDAEFNAYRGRFVLLRPDRFVAASWKPGHAPDLAVPLLWSQRPSMIAPSR